MTDDSNLTEHQRRVLDAFLEDGASNKVLADRLAIADCTVKAHMAAIIHRTGCRNRAQLAVRMLKQKSALLEKERDDFKQSLQTWNDKLLDGTLHALHCNADHTQPVGCDMCSCATGRVIKRERHRADVAEASLQASNRSNTGVG